VYTSVFAPVVWVGAVPPDQCAVAGHVTVKLDAVLVMAITIVWPAVMLDQVKVVLADRVLVYKPSTFFKVAQSIADAAMAEVVGAGSCAAVAVPEISVKAGCALVKVFGAVKPVTNWFVTAALVDNASCLPLNVVKSAAARQPLTDPDAVSQLIAFTALVTPLEKVSGTSLPDAVPVREAVMVPALKFPLPSLATIAEAVLALAAVVFAFGKIPVTLAVRSIVEFAILAFVTARLAIVSAPELFMVASPLIDCCVYAVPLPMRIFPDAGAVDKPVPPCVTVTGSPKKVANTGDAAKRKVKINTREFFIWILPLSTFISFYLISHTAAAPQITL